MSLGGMAPRGTCLPFTSVQDAGATNPLTLPFKTRLPLTLLPEKTKHNWPPMLRCTCTNEGYCRYCTHLVSWFKNRFEGLLSSFFLLPPHRTTQVAWDVDERPSSGTIFLTSAGSGPGQSTSFAMKVEDANMSHLLCLWFALGPLGRTSYLRLGALVSLFTKYRSTPDDQVCELQHAF